MEPLPVLAEAQGDEAAAAYCEEGDEPARRENRDLGAQLGHEDGAIAENAEPQEIDQHLVGDPQDNQDNDDDRGEAEQDNPRSHQSGSLALEAARNVAHVLAHHVRRAQPDEDFEADETDQDPVEFGMMGMK